MNVQFGEGRFLMRVRAIFKCSFCRGSFFALANGLWIKKVSKWTVLVQLKELLSFSFFFLLRLLLRHDYLFRYSKSSSQDMMKKYRQKCCNILEL